MESILYLFSQFTPEALLFEAWLLFLLLASYAAFYIFRKRRYGLAETTIPTGLVKVYLSQLVADAQHMRAQLFGILRSSGVRISDSEIQAALEAAKAEGFDHLIAHLRGGAAASSGGAVAAGTVTNAGLSDPNLQRQLVEVEGKLQQQAEAITKLQTEKTKLQSELEKAKSGLTGAAASAPAGAAADSDELRKKLKSLEDRLEEYSIIEDDLANLKRLQQENAQLKAALQGKGPAPAEAVEPAAPFEEPAASTETPGAAETEIPAVPVAEAVPAEGAVPVDSPAAEQVVADFPTTETAPEAPAPEVPAPEVAAAEAPVEAEIPNEVAMPVAETAPPVEAAEPASAPTPGTEASTPEKSEADLVAEFEKMLQ